MNLSDDLIRHELRNLVTHNMTRSRSQSTDSVNESIKSTMNETKQSIYIDEILQDDFGHNFFCLSCCFKFDESAHFLKHLSQHHSNQIKLTYSQEKFLKQSSFEYHFLSISIDSRIKAKFLQKYSHDLIVLNEETAVMLDELNKEENEEDYYSDPSDKELSIHDENNFYDLRPKMSLLFVDYSIIKPGRIFSYLKELFVKSYPVFKSNSNEARNEISISDEIERMKESNENTIPRKASGQVFHSRNACKKLKCPKCNWHYKYRETLDIHMREKHSTDLSQTMSQQCVYCIENIQHPRLGRGEQYKCGYKPYRCDICDYSTTTKGNLSIHMQSDKHINNLKEIASKPQEKTETKEVESSKDVIDSNRKLLNKKYLNSKILTGNLPQDQSNNSLTTTSNKSKSILPQTEIDISLLCPLCHIGFSKQILLEKHLKESHCVSNEDTIKKLVKTALKSEQIITMKTSNDDEFVDNKQENDLKMNVDNQADADLFLDNLINKHNDILDTLVNNYLFKNRLIYQNFLANLIGNNQTVISENLDTTFVQCSNCSTAKFSNLTDLKKHLIDSHDQNPVQLNKSLVKTCLKHFSASKQDELKNFIASNASNLSDNSIDFTISSLILNRMNKTFSLNKPAANKLPFSAESLLSSQPKQAPPTVDTQLLSSYFKSAQMASAQPPNPLFNQFFLPFMFSPSPLAAAQPAPVSPDTNDDSLKSDNLDESLDVQSGANRRRRTRITEEQLKILRQYFDINKSPTDEQIIDIARQTQLQAKVIKHWFRNTLFKERQKDKDSPYNFNNPPLTQLNLEEYEKTGKIVAEPAQPLDTKFEGKQESLNESNESHDELNQQHSSDHLDMDENDEQNISSSRCSSVGVKNRPNRTKFTEFQIKALNQAFKQQKYPKDEQISQLAGQLGLKPRVITVWFQNARQKARKSTINKEHSDEMNTTNGDDLDEYYDMNDDCDETQSHVSSSTDKSSNSPASGENMLALAAAQAAQAAANTKALQLQLTMSLLAAHQQQQQQQLQSEKLSSSSSSASSSDSKKNEDEEDELDDDEDDIEDEEDETDSSKLNKIESQHKSIMPSAKRLRTTILPEQQEFLMQKYQLDQNPSRKMLDEIAKQVRLKKRVVQVWFQNTRARERKGIIKISPTLANQSSPSGSFLNAKMIKKCPNCSQGFRSRNELESHLILKHNYSYEQASSIEPPPSDEEVKSEAKSSGAKSPLSYQSNGLNSMLMSALFAHLQQQQQQQQNHQQQQPFDLSFKSKSDSIIKPISQNIENRSRSNSSSGTMNISKLKSFNHSSIKREAQPIQNQRRVRTQMTQYQVNVMRLIFAEYKTPTMNECELMGKEINLKKRVVQVWFQNARAKEKKNNQNANRSILFSNSANNDLSNFEFSSDECLLCGVKYTAANGTGVSQHQREHLFSKQHLNKLIQFVTKIAVENGANSVDFCAKNGVKNEDDDESELEDEVNSEDEEGEHSANQENESQNENESKLNSSFDVNRLLQMPQQTPPPTSSQFYNYFLYSNLLNQPKILPSLNSTSASSESSTCSTNSTPSSANTSPPFYSQFQNPVLAQIYAAFAAQQHSQLTTLDGLNLAKSVQADIEKQLASAALPAQVVQYTLDGSSKSDLMDKYNLDSQDIEEHVQTCHYICRTCRAVSASRDALLTHQCLNQIVNMNLIQSNVFKLEQVGYKCVTCAKETQSDCVFANAADFVEHSTKLGHFMIKKMNTNAVNIKRKDEIDLDSNNNSKKLKY